MAIDDITEPSSLETVGEHAFEDCVNLSNVQFGSNLTTIGSYAFQRCRTLNNNQFSSALVPESVTRIGTYAFYQTGLWNDTSSHVEGVIYAGNWVVGYDNITNSAVSLEADTVGIADYAFFQCNVIESVTRLNNVRYIGRGAFCECSRLAAGQFEC